MWLINAQNPSFLHCDLDEYLWAGCPFWHKNFANDSQCSWLKSFGVPDLHSWSHEPPSKSRKVPDDLHINFKNKADDLYQIGIIFHGEFNSIVYQVCSIVAFTYLAGIFLIQKIFLISRMMSLSEMDFILELKGLQNWNPL